MAQKGEDGALLRFGRWLANRPLVLARRIGTDITACRAYGNELSSSEKHPFCRSLLACLTSGKYRRRTSLCTVSNRTTVV